MNTYVPFVEPNLKFAQHNSGSSYATLLHSNKILTTSHYTLRTGLMNRISNCCKLTKEELNGQASQVDAIPINCRIASNQRKGGRKSA